jgi:hypothetical protein
MPTSTNTLALIFFDKKVLRHSWEEEGIAGTLVDVPRYKDGKKKPDNGVLPVEHPSIIWLADKSQGKAFC